MFDTERFTKNVEVNSISCKVTDQNNNAYHAGRINRRVMLANQGVDHLIKPFKRHKMKRGLSRLCFAVYIGILG